MLFFKKWFGKKSGDTCCGHCKSNQKSDLDLNLSESDKAALKKAAETVVVGKILTIRSHTDPKITKVRITKCAIGSDEGEVEQILCGGINIEENMIVPVAKMGTDLGGGFVIGEREIRGEMSRGMICSREELGLSMPEKEKGGIWPLPPHFEKALGTPLRDLA